jgi:hypothetical protein|nr:MAG TPA: RRN7 Zinc-finger of RNA-polymerase I-specific TFIIB, Rrn7 [Caudoviricetes sp.]
MKQQAICELCMQAFEKRSANQKYCTECGVEMRKQQHREIIKNSKLRKTAARNYNRNYNKPDTLEEKCKKINLYNKRHNTHYSYGEYTALERLGRI